MGSMSPGWYDDGHGSMRWWDGAQWTEHVAAPEGRSADAGEQQPAETIPVYQAAGGQQPAETIPVYQGAGDTAAFAAPSAGGYPAHAPVTGPGTDQGAFVGAGGPRKSRVWIVWVVAGVALLGVLIALAIVVPMIFLGLTTGAGSSGVPTDEAAGGTSAEPAAEEPVESDAEDSAQPPSAADQQAAADAVESYNEAWLVGDCESYFATTTEQFRGAMETTNCESFALQSRNFAGAVDNYVTTIGDVETVGSTVAVSTTETYTSMYDDDGNQTDGPVDYEDRYEYVLVSADGVWVIDDVFTE
jgi:hypothetical protein